MRQLRIKRIFALLLAVMLCIGGLTSTATWISAAQETFINPKTGFRNNTLINRVLEEDGFLYGINYVWIEEGHTFGDNHIFGYDTNTFSDGNGAEIVYTNMLNLKALGYNCVQIMASGNRMEGIRFDERGQVLGLDEEYKANFRRYLQAIVAADMPFGVVLQSHTTRLYEYIGKTAWDQGTQYYCNPQVRKQYMELVMEPLLEIIAEFEEHLLFLAFGDELENEINDVTVDWNVSGGRGVYGVSFEDMYAFYSDLNDLCKEMLPDIPRTLAGNADFITQYGDLNLDFLGRNNYYSDESVTPIEQYKIGLPMYAPEWGLTVWSNPMSTEEYINGSLAMSANLREAGYLGAFYWSFDHTRKSDAECTLFNTYYEFSSDFSTFATALTYQALDYRYAHQGVGDPFDVPAIFAYQGDGVVTWLRSRQAKTFDLERSVDGGKSWTKLLSNAAAADYVAPRNDEIGYYVDTAVEEGDAAIYRVTARRADGATRMSAPSVQVFPEEVSADESGTELPTEEDDNNLVLNGNFSLGAEGWRFNGTGTGVVNGALYLPGPSEFCSEAISQKITVEPNREYILSYDMKSANGSIMGVYIKRGSNNSILCEDWPVTSVGQWETKMLRFNVGDNSSVTLNFSNATVGDKYVDNVSLTLVDTGKVRYSVTDFVPSKLTCADESKNLLNDPGFEGAGGAWDTDTFVDGTVVTVVTDGQNAHSGNRYLQYAGQGLTDTHRAIFYVDVAPHTNYTFSAWVRGHYLSNENNGDVTFGVFDPDTGNYLVAQPWDYLEGYKRDSNEKRSLVPTAFDGDWHLRGMNFDTEDMTRIGIMISGTDARMDLDDLTLCKSADAVAYRHPQNTTNLTTTLYLGERGCAPENNLLPNWDLEEADTAYWSNVDGYGRFVVIEDVRELGFGHSLHYTGTERPLGNVYIRWMTVKPYTDYVLSFSIKVEQEGAGFVGLLDGDTAVPDWFDQIEFLQDYYGDEWGTFSFCFNSDVFSRVGLAIADYGGEAYLDNFRLFRVEDAAPLVNVDPYASVKNGWHKEDGKWAYYENGVKVTNKWVKDSVGWCYLGEDGYAVTNCWKKDSHGWCYLNGSGSMTKNAWVKDGGKWYFLDQNGYMVTNAWKKDSKGWVYVGKDGAMLTNAWCKDSQGWCYVGANGYAVTNTWKKDSTGWCYLNGSGSMTKNAWIKDNGKWYFLDANGYMVSNKWMKDSKGWVWVGADGAMKTNAWVKDSKGWCYVGANGYAVTNTWKKDSTGWCYLDSNGSMTKSAWVKDGGKWYYLDANGYMVAGKTVTISGKKYTFNASGVWVD